MGEVPVSVWRWGVAPLVSSEELRAMMLSCRMLRAACEGAACDAAGVVESRLEGEKDLHWLRFREGRARQPRLGKGPEIAEREGRERSEQAANVHVSIKVEANGALSACKRQQHREPQMEEEEELLGSMWSALLGHQPLFVAPGIRVSAVACNHAHAAFVTDTGRLFAMGDNTDGALGLGSEQGFVALPSQVPHLQAVEQVSCGLYHTMAVTREGIVFAAGCNQSGQLGLGALTTARTFSAVEVLDPLNGKRVHVESVVCAQFATFLLTRAGQVFASGMGTYGSLGLGDTEDRVSFTLVESFATHIANRVMAVAAGRSHTCFLTQDGLVYMAGMGKRGQMGKNLRSTPWPQLVTGLPLIETIECGYECTVCVPRNSSRIILLGEKTTPVHEVMENPLLALF